MTTTLQILLLLSILIFAAKMGGLLSTRWQLDCPICGRNTIDDRCEHNPSFVSSVPVEHVVKATLDLFASR